MIERHHTHWQRLTAAPHQVRREVERQVQGMPMAPKHRERSHWSSILSGVAFGGAYITHDWTFVFVGLVMATVAVTQFVLARRPM